MNEDNWSNLLAKHDVYGVLLYRHDLDEDTRASLTEFLADRLDWVSEYTLIQNVQKIWNADFQPQRPECRPHIGPS